MFTVGDDMPFEHITLDQLYQDPTQVQIDQNPYPQEPIPENNQQREQRGRITRELRGLRTFYNPNAGVPTGEEEEEETQGNERMMVSIDAQSETLTFGRAWNHQDNKEKTLCVGRCVFGPRITCH